MSAAQHEERLRRWRLVLGAAGKCDGTGCTLSADELRLDAALFALDDSGAPCFDHEVASAFTSLGVPAFACTPDLFPDLMASAIQRRDIGQ